MIASRKIFSGIRPYGIDHNPSTGVVSRIGDMDGHRFLPVQSQIKGVILDDLGNEVMELPPDDWTSVALDGSLGQVMVRIPDHWMKFLLRSDGSVERAWLSWAPVTGFFHVPKYHLGFGKAAVDRTVAATPKLASVVNTTAAFRGGNNNSAWDGTHRSLLGRAATATSLTSFRTYARNRNGGDTRWNVTPYFVHRDLCWLYFIEYASFNTQAAFNPALTSDGFRQGGLGPGVTTWDSTSWNNYNGYYPLIPIGVTNTLGNGTGVVSHTIKASDGTDLRTFSVPRYRGIESPFGDIWEWRDGLLTSTDGRTAYACESPSQFSDTITSSYSSIGTIATGGYWIGDILFGSKGDTLGKASGGSDSTKFYDYMWNNNQNGQVHALLVGGGANSGSPCGLLCSNVNHAPSSTHALVGARLCFVG